MKNFYAAHRNPNAQAHARTRSDQSIALSFASDADIPRYPDDDATLTFGAGSALATVHEQGGSDANVGSPGFEQGTSHVQISDNATGSSVLKATSVDAQEVKSRHTSRTSTINGDDIGAEEHNLADEPAPKQNPDYGLQTPGDEIDWENDGEEDNEQKTSAPTPSGKRSRTNEPEGLPDGTDNKRRRT